MRISALSINCSTPLVRKAILRSRGRRGEAVRKNQRRWERRWGRESKTDTDEERLGGGDIRDGKDERE